MLNPIYRRANMLNISEFAWPINRLDEAVEFLSRVAGLKPRASAAMLAGQMSFPDAPQDPDQRLERAAIRIGIEIEAVESTGAGFTSMLRKAGPAVLRHRIDGELYFILLLKASSRTACLIGPNHRVRKCSVQELGRTLLAELEAPIQADLDKLLQHAAIPESRRPKVRTAMLAQRMEGRRIDGCWMLRLAPGASFRMQMSSARLLWNLAQIVIAFTCIYALEAGGWVLIGHGALNGRVDPGWLVAWMLILFSMIPLQLWGRWLQGMFSIRFGSLLKRRLLHGALQMNTDEVRQLGAGRLLGQVIESSVFDALALNGGFSVLVAAIELCLAAWALSWTGNSPWLIVLLASWLVVSAIFIGKYYRNLRQWTHARLELTHDLVERMVGHRTRMAQESPDHRHQDEDRGLEEYVRISADFDRAFAPLAALLPRIWLIIGILGLAPELVSGNPQSLGLAIGLGGVLLAYRAFAEIATGWAALARAQVAWEQIAPLFVAGNELLYCEAPDILPSGPAQIAQSQPMPLLRARNLSYRYHEHGEAVLSNCDLTVFPGDKLLLEGPSGGGKSTLAALLVGLRRPDSGLLLLNGLDPSTLGNSWRQHSTQAPQFHENHILSGTIAFNLLMGRRWPALPEDLAEAEALCRELGLGELLEAMPSGMLQMVGETGWQLSHGERSRLYLARALLQKAKIVVLDESFAALDPETLHRCLRCALARAPTLLVIAHP